MFVNRRFGTPPKTGSFYIDAYEVFIREFFANPTVYSPLPQPNSSTIGWSFLKWFCHFPRNLNPLVISSLLGWSTFEKVSFS